MAMNFKNQYNGMLTLRGVTEGANLSIRNSWRLFRSAEVLFTEKDYASAVALAVLALEENGKYLTEEAILKAAVAQADRLRAGDCARYLQTVEGRIKQ